MTDVEQRGTESVLHELLQAAKTNQLLPPDLDVTQFGRLLKVYVSIDEAMANYEPQASAVKVTLLRAADNRVEETELDEPMMGWKELALGGVEVYEVPGDHFTMVQPPHVQILAERLRECLASAEQMAPSETAIKVE